MLLISKCPVCNGKVEEKEVTEIIKGGNNTATLTIDALVCCRCGERFYSLETIKKLEEITAKLKQGETQDFTQVGQAFVTSL